MHWVQVQAGEIRLSLGKGFASEDGRIDVHS